MAKVKHSKDFKKVQMYYKMGIYTKQMVHMLVGKLITADEYEEITGEPYESDAQDGA